MNADSCDCRLIDVPLELRQGEEWVRSRDRLERPGDFFWQEEGGRPVAIVIRLPGNAGGSVAPIPITGDYAWGWDGNLERPTLTPSIWRNKRHPNEEQDHPNEWHGWLRAGRLESC